LREKDPSGAWSNLHSSLLGATALPPDLPFSRAGGFLLVTPCAHSVRGNTCCRPSLPACWRPHFGRIPSPRFSPAFSALAFAPRAPQNPARLCALALLLQCEEAAYEERHYPAGKWACVTKGEPLYEQSISLSFMKLMRYICKENSVGRYLGMTVPVLNEIHLNEEGTELEREVLTVTPMLATFPGLVVAPRVFYGITTEETILREIGLFWELLGSTDAVLRETYIVATYQNPSVPQRRNEIWFIRRAE
uniref:Heme-binding protein 1 n=1 Tax=Anas platyrhynchos TaxID=8839 RepID=A0A8B9SVM1_ANAPL